MRYIITMYDRPLISIIIPIYNAERFLSECIESVIAQTYDNIEIIAVDDGSTDGSMKVLTSYAERDSRIIIINQSNAGPSAARNNGLKHVKGNYIAFVDADDTLSVDFIRNSLSVGHECDIIAGDMTDKYSDLGICKFSPININPKVYLEKILYKKKSNTSVCGKLFKVELFDALYFWPYRYEDLELFPQIILRSSSICLTGYNDYYYRPNPESFMNTFSSNRLDAYKAVQSVVELCISTGNECLVKAAESRMLSASFNMFLITYSRILYKNESQQFWETIRRLRLSNLLNRKVGVKMKVGIVTSYFGKRALILANKFLKVSK